jgi:uncharacterized protein YndB with AHSA1/START domain
MNKAPAPASATVDDDRVLRLERHFKAPPAVLFSAYSSPAHLMRWYGPGDYPLTFCEMDFRSGGRFSFAMTGPDGVQMPPFGGRYLEVTPPRTIVWTVDTFEDNDGPPIFEVTVHFHDNGDGTTRLEMVTVFDSPARKLDQTSRGFADGVSAAFDTLDVILPSLITVVGGAP